MTFLSRAFPAFRRPALPRLPGWQAIGRGLVLGGSALLILVGGVGSVLPGHLGLPFLIAGLIILLRSSRPARRRFVVLQRRHPNIVFPLRRLLRRKPEVWPVAWQQLLRMERLLLPARWRPARSLRRRWLRSGRSPSGRS